MKPIAWPLAAAAAMFYYSWSQTAVLIGWWSLWTPTSRLLLCVGLSLYIAVATYVIQLYLRGKL